MNIHLIMPMAGAGTRFFNENFNCPKPLIALNDRPFFYWATRSLTKFIEVSDITFAVLKDHVEQYGIDQKIKKYFEDAKIIVLPKVLNGAVLTCTHAVEGIEDDLPILFNDCDHMFVGEEFNNYCNINDFSTVDGGLLTFESLDPKYSFVNFDDERNVTETAEKRPISTHAICGAYYFRNKQVFLETVKEYLQRYAYSEFYMSGLYNELILSGKKVKAFATDVHVSFGTPEEYFAAQGDSRLSLVI